MHTSTANPTVTIITATRNRPQTLERTLRSIFEQTYSSYEVLVLDDGSDRSIFGEYEKIWMNLDDRFVIRSLRPSGAPGGGPSPARNEGIRLAKGTFVAFLDDDDWWEDPAHLASA